MIENMWRAFTNRNSLKAKRPISGHGIVGIGTLVFAACANVALAKSVSPFSPALIEAAKAAEAADVVVIGELHPNQEHHENQAALVELLAPSAVVFEMIDIGQGQAFAEGFSGTDQNSFETRIEDGEFGWPSLGQYLGILAANPDARIFGAASPRAEVRNTVTQGAAEIFGQEAERFGLTQDLPPDQQSEREELQKIAHCNALPEDLLSGMVEAQRFRDAVFARRVLEALEATSGPVVLITGNGHAREDWGVPAVLKFAAPEIKVVSIGQSEVEDPDNPFDLTLRTAPFDEGDPCDQFKKSE